MRRTERFRKATRFDALINRSHYLFTSSWMIAGGIALVEPLVNAVVFFFHERAWESRDRPALLDVLVHRHGTEERSLPG